MWVVKTLKSGGAGGDDGDANSGTLLPKLLGAEAVTDRVLQELEAHLENRPSIDAHLIKAVVRWIGSEVHGLQTLKVTDRVRANFAEHAGVRGGDFAGFVVDVVRKILDRCPVEDEEAGVLTVELPLIGLVRDPKSLIQTLVERNLERHFDGGDLKLGAMLAKTVVSNMCRVSGLSEDDAERKPNRIKWPKDWDGDSVGCANAYFKGTPIGEILLSPVAVKVSDRVRMEHCLMTAGAGHGKSQTLQHMIARDLDRPKGSEVGMVVIDSQGDLISRITRLQTFANSDRLLIVDAADVEYPVSLNIFNLGGASLKGLSQRDREQTMNATIQLYEYVIGGLFGSEMTQKQSTVFRFLIRLMLAIPNATIHTLRECLEEPNDFRHVMERLPTTAKQFFLHEFLDRQFTDTRKQILRRLYGVLQNPAFERMFASSENRLDLYKALNEGRVVVCNTSREYLQNECCVFGRYCIAVALKAAFDRARLAPEARRTSFLYIDEASDYFDESVGQLLVQARKYKLGVILAHQALDQMSDGLRAIVMANTSVKLVGGASAKDARYMAAELRTSPEFILAQEKTNSSTRFAAFVRNITPSAVSWGLPFGTMERMPRMSDHDYQALLTRNRAEISATTFGDASDANVANDGFEDGNDTWGVVSDRGDFSEPY